MDQTTSDPHWIEAENGYAVALASDTKQLLCRNKAGKLLASVPGPVRKGPTAQRLLELGAWLAEHRRECVQTVEQWMLGSLPIPRAAIEAAWPDPSWRQALEHAVVAPATLDGEPDLERAGFLRGVDRERGVGVVNLDGESEWIDVDLLMVPHPILLPDLQDFRGLLAELSVEQGLLQLFRETFTKPSSLDPGATAIRDYRGGKFEMISHAVGRSRSLGYRVRGGYATCSLLERRAVVEARYWIGVGDAYEDVWTGDLCWVDADENVSSVASVGPIALSEGLRMASSIYAGRAKDEEEQS